MPRKWRAAGTEPACPTPACSRSSHALSSSSGDTPGALVARSVVSSLLPIIGLHTAERSPLAVGVGPSPTAVLGQRFARMDPPTLGDLHAQDATVGPLSAHWQRRRRPTPVGWRRPVTPPHPTAMIRSAVEKPGCASRGLALPGADGSLASPARRGVLCAALTPPPAAPALVPASVWCGYFREGGGSVERMVHWAGSDHMTVVDMSRRGRSPRSAPRPSLPPDHRQPRH
jgi:hypothetical protein